VLSNTTIFPLEYCSRLRGISTNWSLSPLQRRSQRKHRVRLGEATHARLKYAAHPRTQVKTRTQMTTQGVRDSNGAQFSNTTKRMRGSRILSECLDYSSMHLGVPFIAPRQLGAVEDQLGRPILPSVEWCTGQSGAPPDSYCSLSGA
jgi:hypothetical protein